MLCAISAPKTCNSFPQNPNFSQKPFVSSRIRISALLPEPNGEKVEYTPWLIVGLGNPGKKYHGTRHNVGFEMIDRISEAEGIVLNTIQSKALMGIGSIGQVPVLLAKPQAYMNFSGESVGPLAAYYQVPLRHILLIYDEMSLQNGILRLQPKGGYGHHNGIERTSYFRNEYYNSVSLAGIKGHELDQLKACSKVVEKRLISKVKSVMEHLDGCKVFPRMFIGIGKPPGTMDMKAFLLQNFGSTERQQIDEALEQGVDAVRNLVLHGFNSTIDRFNLEQKYKFHKV